MSLKDAMIAELRADTGVAALVDERVFKKVAPQGKPLPYITVQRISNSHVHHLTAASGLADARVQVSCWDTSDSGAEALAEAVREALDGFTQDTLGSGDNTADVRRISLDNDRDHFVPSTVGSDIGTHGMILDFDVWYGESVPTFS